MAGTGDRVYILYILLWRKSNLQNWNEHPAKIDKNREHNIELIMCKALGFVGKDV